MILAQAYISQICILMLVLEISDNGSARYDANCLMSPAGKSPGTVALFVITLLNTNQTCAGWNWGISLLVNGGTEISSVFRGSYRFWMDAHFSAILFCLLLVADLTHQH